ncbi:hypothetical protein Tco_1389174, partial [Tanacetum coccineum]
GELSPNVYFDEADLAVYGDHNGSNAKAKHSMEIEADADDEDSKNVLEGGDDVLGKGFCDANWTSIHNEGKSTSGYVFTLGGAVVSWKSSKQTMNTKSTMEAKFVALDKADEKAKWIRSFLDSIPLWPKHVTAVCIHCDSMAALTRAKNHIYNSKSRHIRRRHNTIKDLSRN